MACFPTPVIRSVVRIEQPSTRCWMIDRALSIDRRISPSGLSCGSRKVFLQERQRYLWSPLRSFPNFFVCALQFWQFILSFSLSNTILLKCLSIVKKNRTGQRGFFGSLARVFSWSLEGSNRAVQAYLSLCVSSKDVRVPPHGSAALAALLCLHFEHTFPKPASFWRFRFHFSVLEFSACGPGSVRLQCRRLAREPATREFGFSTTLAASTCWGLCFSHSLKYAT